MVMPNDKRFPQPQMSQAEAWAALERINKKPTNPINPKDAVGASKWRISATIPQNVIWEVGVGMLEGALKYGRHNYRQAGVRASIYYDASKGHLDQWWEGEDVDPDSGLSHITKAICSLVVLRDAMMRGMLNDDRPPPSDVSKIRAELQDRVNEMLARYPDPVPPITRESV